MRNLFGLIAMFIALMLASPSTYAAFPASSPAPATAQEAVAGSSQQLAAPAEFGALKIAPAPQKTQTTAGGDAGLVFGILSLVFGILSLFGGVIGVIFAAAAIVLGLFGLNYSWKALSLAGLILGIVGGVISLITIAT